MNRSIQAVTLTAALGLAGTASADYIVNDTWADGSRTDPAGPVYSEFGVDADVDGDLESAWFASSGTLNGTEGNPITPGVGMVGTVNPNAASSWTTYFAPAGDAVALNNAGDELRITWKFTLGGVIQANTGHDFRIAVVDSPEANRIATDTTPGAGAYRGYAALGNMAPTFAINNGFRIAKKGDPDAANELLSDSSWSTVIANDAATNGTTGYVTDVEYTFTFTAVRNDEDGLIVTIMMEGGSLGDDGLLFASTTDAAPHTFAFDTFAIRARNGRTADTFTTSVFSVEFIPVPEPGSLGLLGLGAIAILVRRSGKVRSDR